jgi:hypothetical protein
MQTRLDRPLESKHTTGRRSGTKLPAVPSSSSEIAVVVPSLPVNEWTSIDVAVATGLAAIGGPVQVVPPDYLKFILRCDGHVRDQDKVRIRVQNMGSRAFAESEFPIRLYPAARRRSFPEINIDLSEVKI